MNTPKFGRTNNIRNLLIAMSTIVILLFAVVITLSVLNIVNWKKDTENDNKLSPSPTKSVSIVTPTPKGNKNTTPTAKPTLTPVPTKVAVSNTSTPTPVAPVVTQKPVVTTAPAEINIIGISSVPEKIRNSVNNMALEAGEYLLNWNGPEVKNPKVRVETFTYPAYVSVLLTCSAEGTNDIHREAYTFDADTYKVLSAKDMFRESYLAILKQRLQPVVGEEDAAFLRTSFVTYDEPYRAADYNSFYIHSNKVTFIFPNGTFTEVIHKEFSYDVDLSEATAFMYRDTKGNSVGYQIRKDLDPKKPMIAITFDDGPYYKVESRLIDICKKHDAKCTFFAFGNRIETYESCAKSIRELAKAGHEIGSQTYDDVSFSKEDCNKKTFWNNVNNGNLLIAKTLGYAPTLVRMPGGMDRLKYMANNMPMPMINWYLDSKDWDGGIIYPENFTEDEYNKEVNKVYLRVMENVGDGQILLFHSLYNTTADVVDQVMTALSGQDYQFVTVSELFYYKGIELENGTVSYGTAPGCYNKDYSK